MPPKNLGHHSLADRGLPLCRNAGVTLVYLCYSIDRPLTPCHRPSTRIQHRLSIHSVFALPTLLISWDGRTAALRLLAAYAAGCSNYPHVILLRGQAHPVIALQQVFLDHLENGHVHNVDEEASLCNCAFLMSLTETGSGNQHSIECIFGRHIRFDVCRWSVSERGSSQFYRGLQQYQPDVVFGPLHVQPSRLVHPHPCLQWNSHPARRGGHTGKASSSLSLATLFCSQSLLITFNSSVLPHQKLV